MKADNVNRWLRLFGSNYAKAWCQEFGQNELPRVRGRKMNRQLLISTMLLPILFFPASADERVAFWKLYAGDEYRPADNAMMRKIRRNEWDEIIVPEFSEIKCEKGAQFGIGYAIVWNGALLENYEITMVYPHLEKVKNGKTSSTRKLTNRRNEFDKYQLLNYFWSLKLDELKDGDFIFLLHRDETVLLRHVFMIRGCDRLG